MLQVWQMTTAVRGDPWWNGYKHYDDERWQTADPYNRDTHQGSYYNNTQLALSSTQPTVNATTEQQQPVITYQIETMGMHLQEDDLLCPNANNGTLQAGPAPIQASINTYGNSFSGLD